MSDTEVTGSVLSGAAAGGDAALESLVARVADEFQARQAAGGWPDPEEYAARHPEAAEVLREVLAALRLAGLSARPEGPDGAARAAAGAKLGDFRIVREVGRGGMGVVYEAVQLSLGRRVALKVLPFAATMDPRHLQRFHNEARAAASLHHEHIVPVYAVGCERGVHYYAMQFIDGATLAEVIARRRSALAAGPPDEPTSAYRKPDAAGDTAPAGSQATQTAARDAAEYRRAAELIAQAADALEHAHAQGVVHRDVKPGNLMLDAEGKLWVADFGLARAGAGAGVTVSGDVLGTLRYMSPEQALARHDLVDHRADVYGLGATLYELLTLRPAIDGEDREEILRSITFGEPPPPHRIDRRVPADLGTVALKALARDPAERYATAQDLAEDLRRWLAGAPVQARPVGRLGRLARWCRRNPRVAALSAAVAALLLLVGAVGAVGYREVAAARERGEWEKALARERDERQAELSRQQAEFGRLHVYATWMRRAGELLDEADPKQVREALDRCLPKEGERDLRGWEWRYLDARCRRAPLLVAARPGFSVHNVRWAADGGQVMFVNNNGGFNGGKEPPQEVIELRDAATGRLLRSLPYQGEFCSGSPDGKRAVTARADRRLEVLENPENLKWASWAPDGLHFILLRNSAMRIYQADGGREVRSLAGSPGMREASWSPDGKRILAFTRGQLAVWDASSGGLLFKRDFPWDQGINWGGPPVWHPSGQQFAFGVNAGKAVGLHDAATGRELLTISEPGGGRWHKLSYSPDGRYLLGTVTSRPGSLVVMEAATGRILPLRVTGEGVRSPVWSPDGRRLAAAVEGVGRVWDVETGEEEYSFRHPSGNVYDVSWSPDGQRLVALDSDGRTAAFWEVSALPDALPLPGNLVEARQVSWSPDGKYLAVGGRPDLPVLGFRADRRCFLIEVWDTQKQEQVLSLPASRPLFAWGPGGRELATFGVLEQQTRRVVGVETSSPVERWHTVDVWEVPGGRRARSWKAHNFGDALAWSPDGRHLAACGQRTYFRGEWLGDAAPGSRTDYEEMPTLAHTVNVWDAATGREVAMLHRQPFTAACVQEVCWAPDGGRLAGWGSSGVRVWGAEAGLPPPGGAAAGRPTVSGGGQVAWGPGGRRVAAYQGGRLLVWEVGAGPTPASLDAGQARLVLPGTGRGAGGLAWHPDGNRLVSAGRGAIKIWDVTTGAEVLRLRGPRCGSAVDWSPDGARLASTSDARTSPVPGLAWVWEAAAREGWAPARAEALDQFARSWARLADARAVEQARLAAALAPRNRAYRVNLGLLEYRAGQWRASVETLRRADRDFGHLPRGDARDRFVLAMAQWRLGDREEARACYAQAARWIKENDPFEKNSADLRKEAAELLGLGGQAPARE